MAEELLRANEVQDQYGYSRTTLLRWEEEGTLPSGTVTRTPGGQRRYRRKGLEQMLVEAPEETGGKIPEALAYTELGVSALRRWGGSVYEERLRELRGREGRILLREMRLNDPIISAVFFAIGNALRQADWRVSPASDKSVDREAAEFTDSCFNDLSWSFNDQFSLLIEPMLEQGFSVHEIVYKRRLGDSPPPYTKNPSTSIFNDGRVGWRKWSPRPAESLAPGNEWIIDDHGGIHGINQQPETGEKTRAIPIQKLLLFRTTVHPNNTPEGAAIHRSAYIPYYYTQNIMEIEGIGLERDLAGLPVMYLGEDSSFSGVNSDYELAKDLVINIRNDDQGGVVIPKAKMGSGAMEGRGMLLELLSSGGRRQYDTNQIIERYDKRKAIIVLAQFIMLGMERVGSYALSKHQGDLFEIALTAWLNSIADIINRHAIPRLMAYNIFPGITGNPKLVPGVVSIPDLDSISNYINALVDKQLLTPDDELERHLRQLAKFPEAPITVDGKPQKRTMPLDKAALLARRVSLGVKSLEDAGVLTPEQTMKLMAPLADAVTKGVERAIMMGQLEMPSEMPDALPEDDEDALDNEDNLE